MIRGQGIFKLYVIYNVLEVWNDLANHVVVLEYLNELFAGIIHLYLNRIKYGTCFTSVFSFNVLHFLANNEE